MRRMILRLFCLALCLTLTPLPAPAEEEAAAPAIRVLLRRLNLTDRADLILDGVYSVETASGTAMAFPRGSQLTVQVRNGELYLFYQGMSLDGGAGLRLTRSGAAEGTGLRFEKGGNLYPGDLALTVEGGLLQPVLTISVEDYLLGVVPYEMSEYFPIEALKAQAVCARTYALGHVDASRAWDVVDTTNDQVFKGVNPAHQNAARAVRETAGVVGMYKDKLASCYYSASNGGQTELVENVWSGRGDWDYYAMTDDPYDLENPESVVRKARLSKSGTGLPADFLALLCDELAGEMTRRGFDPSPEAFRVDGISAVSLGGRKFDEPSRMVTELTLTFTWSGRKVLSWGTETPAPTEEDEELSLFSSPEPESTVNSLLSVTPTPTPEPTPQPTPVYSEFIPVEEVADPAGRFNYEMLCGISPRVVRLYDEDQ